MQQPDIFAAPPLPKDTLIIGKFIFHGVPPDDEFADVVLIKEKQLGMVWGVGREIEAIMRKQECDRTPTDRDRAKAYIERCTDEEYIVSLCKVIENDFEEDECPIKITGIWEQCYAYRRRYEDRYIIRVPKVEKFCRLVALDIPKTHASDGEIVLKYVMRFYTEQKLRRIPIPTFEAYPGNPESARRQRGNQ